jgi:hypothetical protein
MIENTGGGPAFPVAEFHLNGNVHSDWRGMTLRDYFAAKAMQSALANAKLPPESWPQTLPLIAVFSYEMANAMLKARGQE